MELDNLKNAWQNLNLRVDRLEEENRRTTEALRNDTAQSAQMRLAKSYKRTGLMGFALPIIAPTCVVVLHMPVWVAVVYAVFGIIMGSLILRSYWITRYTDFISLPVIDALKFSVRLRRRQNNLTILGIVLGAVLLGIFYYFLEDAARWGFYAGLALGLFIGVRKQLSQRELIHEIEDSIKGIGDA